MKNSTSLLLVISALLAAGLTATLTSAADTPSDSTALPPPPPDRRGPPPEVMAIYDVDQNGVLDDDERAVLREDVASGKFIPPGAEGRHRGPGGPGRRGLPPEIVAQYDANKDGKLDDTERAALRADVAAGKIELPARGPEGRPNGRMMRQPPPEILAQYDTNQDGKLDEAERAVLHADIQSGKIAPPHRPGGRGPGPHGGPKDGTPPPEGEADATL